MILTLERYPAVDDGIQFVFANHHIDKIIGGLQQRHIVFSVPPMPGTPPTTGIELRQALWFHFPRPAER